MDIQMAIVKLLKSSVSVSAIVGTKIHPMVIPQDNTLPAITYQMGREAPTRCTDGTTSHRRATFDINLYAKRVSETSSLYSAVMSALENYSGTVTIGAESIVIQRIKCDKLPDGYDDAVQAYSTKLEAIVDYNGTAH